MTYVINQEQAQEASKLYREKYQKYLTANVIGLGISALSVIGLILSCVLHVANVWFIVCAIWLGVGLLIAKITDHGLKLDCMAARFVEYQEKYKIWKCQEQRIDDGFYAGYRRITVVTEDGNGNITERYLGKAKAQRNTRYSEITLDINQEIIFYPYPPKEETC